jgi:hypothetical protein
VGTGQIRENGLKKIVSKISHYRNIMVLTSGELIPEVGRMGYFRGS